MGTKKTEWDTNNKEMEDLKKDQIELLEIFKKATTLKFEIPKNTEIWNSKEGLNSRLGKAHETLVSWKTVPDERAMQR